VEDLSDADDFSVAAYQVLSQEKMHMDVHTAKGLVQQYHPAIF